MTGLNTDRLAEVISDAEADSTTLLAHPSGEWTIKSSRRTIIAMDKLVEAAPVLLVRVRELEATVERVRAIWPDADPCPPRTCTHVDCEVLNALEVIGGRRCPVISPL